MTTCNRPDCTGAIDDTGYCDVCGHQPLPDSPSQITGSTSESSATPWPGGDGPLVGLPLFPELKPPDAVRPDLVVPEERRFCRECGTKVGRSRRGRPGLTTGFCPNCKTPFSFVPALRAGQVVGGRYEVIGPIAHGGVGWIYLAKDTSLDRHVVLKGLISAGHQASADAAIAERSYQTILDHPNIVRPLDFATGDDPLTGKPVGYLVMEYVGGKSLRKVIRDVHDGDLVLMVEHIIAYGLEILKALGYVHRLGLLHCDIKPDNVMTGGGRVRVIDLGAMRRLTDTGTIWGDPDYQVPKDEITERGLTVDSDLYSVGRTLMELLACSVDHPNSDERDTRIAGSVDSFVRIVARAANPDWNRRFASAAEMTEQLTLVLREILAVRGGRRIPLVSAQFAAEFALFDDGLGEVPALDRFADRPAGALARRADILAGGRPTPAMIAGRLPDPLPDPADPNTPALVTVSASDPELLLDELRRMRDSVEVQLWNCRAYLARGDDERAQAAVRAASRAASGDGRHRWRINWHQGLVELVRDRVTAAAAQFDEVLASVPGEAPPKLALGFCAEHAGRTADAERYYGEVWRADDTWVSAAFGLARLLLAQQDRQEAVAVLTKVPRLSRHYNAARIAAVRVLVSTLGGSAPMAADLDAAAVRLAALDDRDAGVPAADRELLAVTVLRAALAWAGGSDEPYRWGSAALARFGSPVTRDGLAARLSGALRRLAHNAADADQRGVLIDYANLVRPRTRS